MEKVADEAECSLKQRIQAKSAVAQGALFNHIGFFQYQQYCKDRDDASTKGSNGLFLESAIKSAHYAVKSFDEIHENILLEKNRNIKYQSMINLAYYFALRNSQKDSREAL